MQRTLQAVLIEPPPKAKPKNNKSWSKNKEKKAQKSKEKQPQANPEDNDDAQDKDDSSADEDQPRNRRHVEVILSRMSDSSDDEHPDPTPPRVNVNDLEESDLRTLLQRKATPTAADTPYLGVADSTAPKSRRINPDHPLQVSDLRDSLNSKVDNLRIKLNRSKRSDLRHHLEKVKQCQPISTATDNAPTDLREKIESRRRNRFPRINVIMGGSPPVAILSEQSKNTDDMPSPRKDGLHQRTTLIR